jgi:ATP-dependent DNA ligase
MPAVARVPPPAGPDWGHEIKHDRYRLIVRRDGATVRLYTRRGYEWTGRFPAITDAAGKLRGGTRSSMEGGSLRAVARAV